MYKNESMIVVSDMVMSEIINKNPYFLLMLEHFGISLAVNEKTVLQICSENNININLFLSFANLFNGTNQLPISEYSFDDICNILKYLRNCHQYYLDESYPKIRNYIKQILTLNHQSESRLIENFFNEYFNEVSDHLKYENDVVFPYALSLYNQYKKSSEGVNKLKYTVLEYKEHHEDIEEKLADLKNLLLKYLPQKKDQQIRRNLLFSLYDLEYDLHIHSQIEDFILIPLLEQMEHILTSEK